MRYKAMLELEDRDGMGFKWQLMRFATVRRREQTSRLMLPSTTIFWTCNNSLKIWLTWLKVVPIQRDHGRLAYYQTTFIRQSCHSLKFTPWWSFSLCLRLQQASKKCRDDQLPMETASSIGAPMKASLWEGQAHMRLYSCHLNSIWFNFVLLTKKSLLLIQQV